MVILKILYKPFAIIAGLVSARIGQKLFQKVWAKVDREPPPVPGTGAAGTPKVVASAALQAATFAGVAAFVDRQALRVFQYFTGAWLESKPKQTKEQKKAEKERKKAEKARRKAGQEAVKAPGT